MNDTESYFRMAADNYRRAEEHLNDTEICLRKLLARLETRVVPVSLSETTVFWSGVDSLIRGTDVTAEREPVPVIS